MKYYALLFFTTLFICCGVANNPSAVAEHFIKASIAMDFKEARKYASPETVAMLDFVQNIAAKTTQHPGALKDVKVEILGETIDGDNATVKYKKEDGNEVYYLELKKMDGKWLVAMNANNMTGKSDEEAGEMEPDSSAAKSRDNQ